MTFAVSKLHPFDMRINLSCPYSDKDQAKSLGARWDAGKKTWYIENVEDLTPFMRWMPKVIHNVTVQKLDYIEPKKHKPMKPRLTGKFEPICACDVLPWDDCPHTLYENEIVAETLRRI